MSTIDQLVRKSHKSKAERSDPSVLNKEYDNFRKTQANVDSSRRCGVCARMGTMTPREPNSALRRYVHARLSDLIEITIYIPSINHNL